MENRTCEHLKKYLETHEPRFKDYAKEPYAPTEETIICGTCNTFVNRPFKFRNQKDRA